MSQPPSSPQFASREVQFTGHYSRDVFETLFWGYRPFLFRCGLATFVGFVGRILILSNANMIGYWVDSLCRGPQCRPVPTFLVGLTAWEFLSVLISITVVGFLCTVVFRVGFSRLSAQAVSRIYDEVTLRTSRFPISFFDTTPTGRVITRFSSDYGNVFRLFGGPLAELFSIVFDLVCMVFLITLASPYFLLIVGVVVACNFLIYRLNREKLRQERRALSFNRSPSIAHFAETVQGSGTIRAFLRQAPFMRRFERLNELFLSQKLQTAYVIMGFSLQMSSLTSLLLLGTGLASYWFTQSGHVSVGAVGVALSFITLSGGTIQMFFEWLAQFEEAMVGVERLDNYLRRGLEPGLRLPASTQFATSHARHDQATEHETAASRLTHETNATVQFHNVWFRYTPHLPYVLKGISFEVHAGEKFGIIGRTGSGKSSLIQALFQFYPIEKGEIRMNGLRPHLTWDQKAVLAEDELDLTVFRRAIGLIAQEPVLFQGTVRENLTLGGRSDEECLQALARVGLDDWLDAFPGALDGWIEERGRNLSLGERQLLCMARCLLQDAPVVVMDEATSSVDPQSEEILVHATETFFAHRTQIIVAHRLSTLEMCDRILWLQNGEIRMLGTPREVLPLFQNATLGPNLDPVPS